MTLGFMREFLFKCNSYACKWTWNLTRVMEKQVGTTKMLGKVSIVIIETCFNREADEGGQHKQEQQLNSRRDASNLLKGGSDDGVCLMTVLF